MKMMKILIAFLLVFGLAFSLPSYPGSVLTLMSDSVNSGIINTKMATDDLLSNIDVDATVENGIAIFSGRVNSRAQLQELIRIARSVSGVRGINIARVRIANVR